MLLVAGCTALLIAFGTNYIASRRAQQYNVAILQRMGGENPSQYGGTVHRTSIWYNDDLKWNQSEHRFQLRLRQFETGAPPQLQPKRTRFLGWISKTFGRDFAHHPVAIEIDCYDSDQSKFDLKLCRQIVGQIKKLPTVRQIWILERTDLDGKPRIGMTNEELAELLPELIVANPQ